MLNLVEKWEGSALLRGLTEKEKKIKNFRRFYGSPEIPRKWYCDLKVALDNNLGIQIFGKHSDLAVYVFPANGNDEIGPVFIQDMKHGKSMIRMNWHSNYVSNECRKIAHFSLLMGDVISNCLIHKEGDEYQLIFSYQIDNKRYWYALSLNVKKNLITEFYSFVPFGDYHWEIKAKEISLFGFKNQCYIVVAGFKNENRECNIIKMTIMNDFWHSIGLQGEYLQQRGVYQAEIVHKFQMHRICEEIEAIQSNWNGNAIIMEHLDGGSTKISEFNGSKVTKMGYVGHDHLMIRDKECCIPISTGIIVVYSSFRGLKILHLQYTENENNKYFDIQFVNQEVAPYRGVWCNSNQDMRDFDKIKFKGSSNYNQHNHSVAVYGFVRESNPVIHIPMALQGIISRYYFNTKHESIQIIATSMEDCWINSSYLQAKDVDLFTKYRNKYLLSSISINVDNCLKNVSNAPGYRDSICID